jgi:hypothetical protein
MAHVRQSRWLEMLGTVSALPRNAKMPPPIGWKTEGEGSDEGCETLRDDLGNLHDRGDVGVIGNVGHNGSGAL